MLSKKIFIQIIIAGLLFGCLLKMPYGYYQFVRIATFILFSSLAYIEYEEHRPITAIMSAGCSILLNPVYKIYFKRNLWNTIDVFIAIALLAWVIVELMIKFTKKRKLLN